MEAALIHANGRTYMTKVTGASRDYGNAPKNKNEKMPMSAPLSHRGELRHGSTHS